MINMNRQLDLCKECVNRFTKEELIKIMQGEELIKIMQGRIDELAGNKLLEEKPDSKDFSKAIDKSKLRGYKF